MGALCHNNNIPPIMWYVHILLHNLMEILYASMYGMHFYIRYLRCLSIPQVSWELQRYFLAGHGVWLIQKSMFHTWLFKAYILQGYATSNFEVMVRGWHMMSLTIIFTLITSHKWSAFPHTLILNASSAASFEDIYEQHPMLCGCLWATSNANVFWDTCVQKLCSKNMFIE